MPPVPPVAVHIVPFGLDFGNVTQSTSTSPLSITITSTGTANADITIVSSNGKFVITPNGSVTLPPGVSKTYNVVFNANATIGSDNAQFFQFTGGGYIPSGPVLKANTVATGTPAWNVLSGSVAFGSLRIGTSSGPVNLTINNTGSVNVIINSIVLGPTDFSLGGLPAFPLTLTPGSFRVFNVTCNSEFAGFNDYPTAITITASTGPAQTVDLNYTGIALTPAYVLTGATQGVLFGLAGLWNGALANLIARAFVSLPSEVPPTFTNQYDFDNPSENTYLSKVFMRCEPSGNATASVTDTSMVSGTVKSVTSTASLDASTDSSGIVKWMQFDFENNGEAHKIDFTLLTGKIVISLVVFQFEPRGQVYQGQ